MDKSEVDSVFPLTELQSGMLLPHLKSPADDIGFLQVQVTLKGTLNVSDLIEVWDRMTATYELLRTTVHWGKIKQHVQVVHKEVEVDINYQDCQNLSQIEAENKINEFLKADRESGLNLSEAPCWRLTLFKTGPETHRFIWSCHHILFDGWSGLELLSKMRNGYNQLKQGNDVFFNEVPPFQTYCRWLKQQPETIAARYWRAQFKELGEPKLLVGKYMFHAEKFETVSLISDTFSTDRLQEISRSFQITPSTLLFGTWALIVSELTQSPKVVIGITVSGRSVSVEGVESMLGMLANILPLCIEINSKDRIKDWFQSVFHKQQELKRFEYNSISQIHKWTGISSRIPLFDSILIHANQPWEKEIQTNHDGNQIEVTQLEGDVTSGYPITLIFKPGVSPTLEIRFDSSYIELNFANFVAHRFQEILSNIYGKRDEPVKALIQQPPAAYVCPKVKSGSSKSSVNASTNDQNKSTEQWSEAELKLRKIWSQVLDLGEITLQDDFFELGGNSFSVLQVIEQIYETFKTKVPIERFLDFPTISEIAKWIIENESNDFTKPSCPIKSQSENAPLLMSYEQEAFWLRSQLDLKASVHNMHQAMWLRGSIYYFALREALRQLLERQSSLRQYFPRSETGNAVALHSVYDPLQFIDLSNLSETEQRIQVDQCLRQQAETPFDLKQDQLLRLQLIKLNEQKHVLSFTMHHILGDAWSFAIWQREWQALYHAACQQVSPVLPTLPIQYTDYAAWQRHHLSGEHHTKLKNYWIEQMRDAPELLNLPTDYTRPSEQQGQGAKWIHSFSVELHEALVRVARQHNSTVFALLFSAFNVLLYRFSGQTDLCVGVPMVNRRHPETKNLIGVFLNTLPLRTHVDGQKSFADLLRQVHRHTLEAQSYVDLPFAHILRELKPKQQQAYNPYFQVVFNWVSIPETKANSTDFESDLQLEPFSGALNEDEHAISNFDIFVTLSPSTDRGISISWHYDKALFKAETIDLLAKGYQHILNQLVEDAEITLKDFTLSDAKISLYPLTLTQRDIWVDQVMHGQKTPMYHIGGQVHLPGPLDIERFNKAVELLIQKHDNLRLQLTKNRDENGLPQQTIVPPFSLQVPLHDFRNETKPYEAARTWMQQRFVQPFGPEGEPLFRFDLIQVANAEYYWLMQYHHLIIDGWGMALLNRSLAEIYTDLSQSKALDLQSPSYLDYIADEQGYLQSERYEKQREYWLQQYKDIPGPLFNPRVSSKGPIASECYPVHLDRAFYEQIGQLAKRYQVSAFHVFIGVLALYFTRTERRDEFVIGLPVLNRSTSTFKKTSGLFMGMSPSRFRIETKHFFGDLLLNISQTLKTNYNYQRFPIGDINQAIKPIAHHGQLYDVGLSFESHEYDVRFDNIESHTELYLNGWEQMPLMLYLRDFHVGADVKWDFVANRAYFNEQEIKRLQKHLMHLLTTVLTQANVEVGKLPLVTKDEYHKIVHKWNATAMEYPKDTCIHELFEAQVEKTPDAIAVIFEAEQLTYKELDSRSNQLANQLAGLGVGPEALVGLCVERSAEMLVGMLGILKAGGAYVPLDPHFPVKRLEMIAEDAGLKVVVTQKSLKNLCDPFTSKKVFVDELAAPNAEEISRSSASPSQAAYVIYTSGSTGRPKGVVLEHRSVVNFLYAMRERLGISESDVLLAVTTISFDISVLELLLPLFFGAQVVIASDEVRLDGGRLAKLIRESEATVLQATPATWKMLLESGCEGSKQLKALVGGEALMENLAKPLHGLCSELWNLYGPTETTVWSLVQHIENPEDITIGTPIGNTQVYVVDKNNQMVPVGVNGELLIGGEGLARGYWQREELTAERFIVNPFDESGAARLYRTGDLVRWRSDQQIEFLGRMDNQVKVRGFRIELGEIETALAGIESIEQCAVVVHQDKFEDKRLVAYYEVQSGEVAEVDSLRKTLKEQLPDYMVPGAFVQLNEIPLTPSGKIDRKKLEQQEIVFESLNEYVAPHNEAEQKLATIWTEMLKIEKIGIHDNFFDLGGHSLLAIQVQSRVRETFDVDIPLRDLFELPTIEKLAIRIESSLFPDTIGQEREQGIL